MGAWSDAAVSLLFGSSCVGCSMPGRAWCPQCDAELSQAVDPVILNCDPPVVVCCGYSGCVPEAVVGHKDRGVRTLGPVLGQVLAAGLLVVRAGLPDHLRPVVVPVPSTGAAVRRRGFDHTWELARIAAAAVDLPTTRLLRSGSRQDSAALSFAARRANLAGSMRVRRTGHGPVILVDDVRTSGATLAEAERVLLAAGYAVMGRVVVAGR
jgi:predicted amidophosphoribosyltransferase